MKIDDEVKFGLTLLLAIYFLVGAIIGIVETADARMAGKDGCVYNSVSGVLNLGRVLACELGRDRFDLHGVGPHK